MQILWNKNQGGMELMKKINRRKAFRLLAIFTLGFSFLPRLLKKFKKKSSPAISYHPAEFYQKLD